MRASVLLRIAAALAAIQGIVHGTLFLTAKPRHGPVEEAVVTAMQTNHFNFAGAMRSYWDFYLGYGLEAGGVCLIEALLLWQLAKISVQQPMLVRPMVALIALANVGHIVLAARYFFYVPIVPDAAIVATLGWAFAAASDSQ